MKRLALLLILSMAPVLAYVCPAQQTSENKSTHLGRDSSKADIEVPAIGGGGTKNYIAIWTNSSTLGDSAIYQANDGNVGIGTTSPAAPLDVAGNINISPTWAYSIGNSNVVSLGSGDDHDLFLGVGAGVNNVAGQGVDNVFTGFDAGNSNTTGAYNTFSGLKAGYHNTSGSYNTFSGEGAGNENTSGVVNTFFGFQAGFNNTTGSGNIFIGDAAGSNNTTGSNDIYIGNSGPTSGAESNAIRIGNSQTATYLAALPAQQVPGGFVCIQQSGLLTFGFDCTHGSSLRFKEQVRDMGNSSNGLMKLRPVTFFYKPEYAVGARTLQYGLIAEEVAQFYPELVEYDKEGKPTGVRYQLITTMLLNELQKQYHQSEKQSEVIEDQQQQIKEQEQEIGGLKQQLKVQNAALQQRLSQLERMVRMELAAK
jgi:hypothetical protein